ncbi:unnamed protein product [Acanthoscelides obtectus]|uniref:Uncharacterized protein n=1 Tax=Acanthoscelides obtectus TaxID=200917 RepID=A0A9P0LAQ5_ACAOB|nr:unnamed protein product [Acanthoscelides obtectus]CAK1630969.1 hypothetical protein AOBTE_LOCUS6681 [Acanthoscelides obtectus]
MEEVLVDASAVSDINDGSRIRKRANKKQIRKRGRYHDPDPDLTKFKRPGSHDNKTFQCQKVKISNIRAIRSANRGQNNDEEDINNVCDCLAEESALHI